MKKTELSHSPWKTKSVLLVSDELEKEADTFFSEYNGLIEVYKARVSEIQQLA